ncbi:MAG: acetyltransferase [Clostridia bacterium]|jgi:putative acetyltransferase|nr:acetyltransferase [Clostridia bacterium]
MIRDFEIDELETLMEIWLKTNIDAHDFINESYWKENYKLVKELLPNATLFIYEDNNVIEGFIGLMESYVAGLFINATSQSKGIGKALLDYVKENHSELSLQVYNKNVGAVKFYLREDFVVLKEQIDENTGEVELVMNWSK